ncbi:hypothetical protein SAMN05421812_110126, partial [Asanoa hainanensis]
PGATTDVVAMTDPGTTTDAVPVTDPSATTDASTVTGVGGSAVVADVAATAMSASSRGRVAAKRKKAPVKAAGEPQTEAAAGTAGARVPRARAKLATTKQPVADGHHAGAPAAKRRRASGAHSVVPASRTDGSAGDEQAHDTEAAPTRPALAQRSAEDAAA